MSTYKPKNSSLFVYDFVMGGQRYSGSTGCKTKRDADRVEAKLRAEIALDSGARKKKPITLDEAAGLYEIRLRETGKWSQTADYIIAGLVESLGAGRYLSDITQQELSDHFARRGGTVSASSVNREIDVARPIWRRVMKTHDIGEMPEWGALRYAIPEKDPRELYHDEEDELFDRLREDYRDFTRFALLSGWRLSEVRNLRWADVNLGQAIASTRIKGGDTVKRPLTDDMIVLIANQAKAGPFVFTYVCRKSRSRFVDKKGRLHPARLAGERYPFTQWGWRKPWLAALKDAGIDSFRFHDLRHTRGTRILRATGNLAVAKEALKHKNIRTTLRYAHAADEDIRRGLDASESRSITKVSASATEKPQKSGSN
jgi:site-specific recombinase XerD